MREEWGGWLEWVGVVGLGGCRGVWWWLCECVVFGCGCGVCREGVGWGGGGVGS